MGEALTQAQMFEKARSNLAGANTVALGLLYGRNPITDEELMISYDKRPELYGRYMGYLGKRAGMQEGLRVVTVRYDSHGQASLLYQAPFDAGQIDSVHSAIELECEMIDRRGYCWETWLIGDRAAYPIWVYQPMAIFRV